jgi:predicted Zn-dependent protease DUF2268
MIQVEFEHCWLHHFSRAERQVVRALCDSTDVEVRRLLPGLSPLVRLTVCVGRWVIPEYGFTGMSVARGHVRWRVDVTRPGGVEAIARAHLRATLFHELHHLVRGYVMSAPPCSVMDAVISEGLATAFERDAAGHPAPWGAYSSDVLHWVDELLALPDTASREHWMFHHPDGRRWIGYRAGTFLADRAMAASGRSAADLVTTSTSEILALALPFG